MTAKSGGATSTAEKLILSFTILNQNLTHAVTQNWLE